MFFRFFIHFFTRLFWAARLVSAYVAWHVAKAAPEPAVKSDIEIYHAKMLDLFLASYAKPVDFNYNIDASVYDTAAMNGLLIEDNSELEQSWTRRVMIERTPRGIILMHYDLYNQAFSYYADQHGIPYSVLNAAAMKYVCTYRCRDFFLDTDVVPKEHPSRLACAQEIFAKKAKTAKKAVQFANDAPFLKPKPAVSGANPSPAGSSGADQRPKQINRFKTRGKIANYSILQKPKKINENNGFATALLSYQDYKRENAIRGASIVL